MLLVLEMRALDPFYGFDSCRSFKMRCRLLMFNISIK